MRYVRANWQFYAYPPPTGGGLIEAHRVRQGIYQQRTYPPPTGGGLIEARTLVIDGGAGVVVSAAHGRRPH